MRAKVVGIFIGSVDNSFVNKDGETIRFKKASFNVPGELENCVFKVPVQLDLTSLVPYEKAYFVADFAYDSKYQNYTGRIRALYPTEKALNDADPMLDGFVDSAKYASSKQ